MDYLFSILKPALTQIVAVVFLFAAAAKLLAPSKSIAAIRAFGIPAGLAGPLGLMLPLIELLVGLSLASGIADGGGALIGAALLLVFTVAQIRVIARGQEVPCGCFGSFSSRPMSLRSVLVNIGLALCCLIQVFPIDLVMSSTRETASLSVMSTFIIKLAVTGIAVELGILSQLLANRQLDLDFRDHQRTLYETHMVRHARRTEAAI